MNQVSELCIALLGPSQGVRGVRFDAGRKGASRTETPVVQVAPAPYVTVALAATITGLSEKAIRRKIEDGKWIEGREFVRSPDDSIFISLKGFERWVEGRHVGK